MCQTKCWRTYNVKSWRGLNFAKNWDKEKGRSRIQEKLETLLLSSTVIPRLQTKREIPSAGWYSWQGLMGKDRGQGKVKQTSEVKGNFLHRNMRWWTYYLIKVWIISSPYSSSVSLAASIHLHHRFDVVPRQLSALDDPNANLNIVSKREAAKPTLRSSIWKIFVPYSCLCLQFS